MDFVYIAISVLFFFICLAYVNFLDQEEKSWKT